MIILVCGGSILILVYLGIATPQPTIIRVKKPNVTTYLKRVRYTKGSPKLK